MIANSVKRPFKAMKNLGLYIHIPFCKKKCLYCDFCSFVDLDESTEERYINALVEELKLYSKRLENYVVDTIFIGGGTPSLFKGSSIEYLMKNIYENLRIAKDCETTIEVNPGTVDDEKVQAYKKAGINRISMGVQSLDNEVLEKIGRIHNRDDVFRTLEIFKETGFENISADIIFNLPGQDENSPVDDLKEILKTGIKHVSYYSLKLEESTPLYKMHERGEVNVCDDEDERKMYYSGRKEMSKRGFYQYEISNFALKGFESRHNLKYWNREEYLGLGLSSHSCLDDVRFSNTLVLNEYLKNIESGNLVYETVEEIDESESEWEYMILGLRKISGISYKDYKNKVSINFDYFNKKIDILVEKGLITKDVNSIKLTEKGLDLSNMVFIELMPD
jgi:oxygen-independent coproporphyrinogen-3 oxidase